MAPRVRKHFIDVSAHLPEVGLATLREIDAEGNQKLAENLVRAEYAHVSLIPAVPKTVLRKCETFETCEIGEILLVVFSTTCVFSMSYGSASENESYLRSQISQQIRDVISLWRPGTSALAVGFCALNATNHDST
jgi:hypothetical protein